jgi:Glutathione synthase/Ribosomal protein S6 modification enzyme (glutaminyl transferase)
MQFIRKKGGDLYLRIQRVRSKWKKTDALLQSAELKKHVPDTRWFGRKSLQDMLDQYGMVYVKPDNGSFGKGVFRVERLHPPQVGYQFRIGTSTHHAATFDKLYEQLQQRTGKRPYLVQRGIHLLTHRKRRFDVRVMVQKNPHGVWETTGMIGRLGDPRKIVTNYHNGATPMSLSRLMTQHLPSAKQQSFTARLASLGALAARQLETRYPRLKEIGVDVAVDKDLFPWILEINTLPDPFLFRKLNDKRVFRKIYRYAVSYGRFKRNGRAASR